MTLVSILDAHPSDATALIERDRSVSYGELNQLVADTRAGLVAAGLERGDRVAIIAESTLATAVSLLATISAGMVAVPLNPSSPEREIARQLEAVTASLVLCGSHDSSGHPVPTATPAGASVVGVDPLPPGPAVEVVALTPESLVVMLFTSGTAGPPKPAMLSEGCLSFVQEAIINHPQSDVDDSAVHLAMLPLAHVYGLNISLLTTLRAGGTVVLENRFDPVVAAELIGQHRVTHLAGVPPMWRAFLDAGIAADTFASMRQLTSGASALSRDLFDEFEEHFGVQLREGYGLTETASVVSSHLGIELKPGSVGVALPGIELLVADYDDNPAPEGDSGIIKVRGKNVFMGYWEEEEATKAVLDDDGWLDTGDVGVMTDDGYLYLVDRAKDLIIVSGFNVYPFEVETVASRHPDIAECVVVGRIDEARGERVVAYATVNEGHTAPSLESLVDFCRTELARYKCPSELRIVDTLPIAPTGKLIRRELA